jgi:predicted naringenin-chalcone synthase
MRIGIQSLATANPPLYVTQKEVFDFYDFHFDMSAETRELYRRILLEGPIRGRYFGLDYHEEALETDPDRTVERHSRFGGRIAADAARKALAGTDYRPADLGGLIVNTCTGYLCPGLSSYLVEALGLDPSVKVLDIMGMGCGAAIPNLECAAGMAALRPDKPVLSVSVEICSATLFPGDDPGLIVSNSIFGDGASAAIVGACQNGSRKEILHFIDFETGVFPAYRNQLRYRTEKGRLRNVLGKRVPVLCADAVSRVVEKLLARNSLRIGEIDWWAVHPGGTSVLRQLGKKLGLSDAALTFSNEIFKAYGNMSSPTVMYVLKKIIDDGEPIAGSKGLLLSFGAGFTAFGALVVF